MLRRSCMAHKRGTVAQVGYDDAAIGQCAQMLWQLTGNVFVGNPVKSVTPDTRIVQLAGQPQPLGQCRLVTMEGRVEAGDLGQRRAADD